MREGNERTMHPLKRLLARRAIIMAGLGGLAYLGIGFTWFTTTRNGSVPTSAVVASPSSKFPSPSPSVPSVASPLYNYEGLTDTVDALAWSPHGKQIASGSFDTKARVWDGITERQTLTSAFTHYHLVEEVACSPNGKQIAVTAIRTMQAWNAADDSRTLSTKGRWEPRIRSRGHLAMVINLPRGGMLVSI